MASSIDDSSEYDSGVHSQPSNPPPAHRYRRGTIAGTHFDREQNEDLFLNLAQDSPTDASNGDGTARGDKRRVSLLFVYVLFPHQRQKESFGRSMTAFDLHVGRYF